MKACVVQELSGPSGLVYADVDDVAGGDDTIVVDVRAAGVCFPDLLLSKGEYQLKPPPPFIPGMEAAGVVASAPEESEFKVGDRVSAFGILGGFAEQVVAPLANVTRSPAELDDAEAVSHSVVVASAHRFSTVGVQEVSAARPALAVAALPR